MSVKTDTENKKGMLVFGQLPQTSAKEAAELEASCLKEAWSKKAWEDALEDKNAWYEIKTEKKKKKKKKINKKNEKKIKKKKKIEIGKEDNG